MSGGVSVLCWLAAPVEMFYGNLQNLVIRSKSVIKSSSVIISQIGVMSDQLRVPLYMVMSQNVTFPIAKKIARMFTKKKTRRKNISRIYR